MLAAEEMIADFRDGYRAIPGKNVVEVLPRAVGKAAAVSHFLSRRNYRGRLPVFLGDDFTDEEAMARVNELGGYSIHVGHSSATCARFRVNSVSEVLTWLENTVLPS
jgi:trehalose 6-phosphate phosphatase